MEFRGYMTAHKKIKRMTNIMMAGIENPQLIQGFYNMQKLSFLKNESFIDVMERYYLKNVGSA